MGNAQVQQNKGNKKQGKVMGQMCCKEKIGASQYHGGNECLKKALEKVGEAAADNLPKARSDPCWKELQETKGLELEELMALKNHACNYVSRGVLSTTINDGTLYKFSDDRVRCNFKISLFDGSIVMPADLLVDSGAECELKLPGRKVLQLGLQQTGVPVHTKGSIPGRGTILKFYPQVWLSATFRREGLNGEPITEEVKELLTVSSDKRGYLEALQSHEDAEEVTGRNCFHTPASGSPPWLGNESSPTTPAAGPHPLNIEIIKLSPVRHRPTDRTDEQALLGFAGLQKLRMHINAEKQQLEIEEETYIEA